MSIKIWWNIWQYSKNFNSSRRWLYNWLFFRLLLFQKILQINWDRFKKTKKLDTDPKEIQQINFTGDLNRAEGSTMFFIIKEVKETV